MKNLLVILAIMALAVSAQAQNLLVNPGFEDDGVTNANPPAGWTSVGVGPAFYVFATSNVIPRHSGNLIAAHGDLSAGGQDAAYLYQQVSGIAIGSILDASVWISGYAGGGSRDINHFAIGIDPTGGTDFDGASVQKTWFDSRSQTWQQLNLNGVVAQSSTVTVFLYSKLDSGIGTYWVHGYDDASLTATVPEPASILALCSGLIGLVGIRRRK